MLESANLVHQQQGKNDDESDTFQNQLGRIPQLCQTTLPQPAETQTGRQPQRYVRQHRRFGRRGRHDGFRIAGGHSGLIHRLRQSRGGAVHRTDIDVWLAGCGLGKDEKAAKLVHTVWQSGQPCLVLDADALHILVDYPQMFLKNTRNDMVLTPHPGEAAYLLNTTVQQVQSHRDWAARELANRYHCWVVLKGHNTVISSARGFLHTNTTGNTGLATAGSGDVLAGMITSLLAQGIKAAEAVPAAVWLHGAAAELLEQSEVGPIGLLSGELAEMLRWLRNRLISTPAA